MRNKCHERFLAKAKAVTSHALLRKQLIFLGVDSFSFFFSKTGCFPWVFPLERMGNQPVEFWIQHACRQGAAARHALAHTFDAEKGLRFGFDAETVDI